MNCKIGVFFYVVVVKKRSKLKNCYFNVFSFELNVNM